jgi:glycosyltransferase involved in cell wall biosynthesis
VFNSIFDLRGLNFSYFTGVNTVTLNLLLACKELNFKFQGLGLKTENRKRIATEVNWFDDVISSHKTVLDYLFSQNNIKNPIGLQNQLLNLAFYLDLNLGEPSIVFQPQPKPISVNKNSKLVTFFHDLSVIHKTNNRTWWHKNSWMENRHSYSRLLDRADVVLINSHSTGFDLMKNFHISKDKIKLIPLTLPRWNGHAFTNPVKPTNETEVARQEYFFALSSFEYRKNYHNLILAWSIFKSQYKSSKDLKLVIAGNTVDKTYFKQLIKLRNDLNLNSSVDFVADVDENTKQNLLKNSICLVYTSLYEGFGLPILEANSLGKAILASNTSSIPEVAGNTGLFINPLMPNEIAEGLEIMYRDRQFRKKLESEALANLSKYSWENFKSSLASVLE